MKKSERATKIAYVSSLTTIANAVTPPAGAFLIERMGGLPKMRVIYLIQFVATLIVWMYTMKLKDAEVLKTEKGKMLPEILLEIKETINVLKENRALWWIWIFTIGSFAYGASSPYWILFAAEAYSSPYVVIGLLSTVYSVTNALTLIPVGRFSDRRGRIRAIKYLRPISYLSFAIFLIGYRFKLSFLYIIPLVVWGLRGIGSACSAPCQFFMNAKENYLRAVEFREPEWIPCNVCIERAIWRTYREKIEEIDHKHPTIFGDYKKDNIKLDKFGVRRKGEIYKDEWGCGITFKKD